MRKHIRILLIGLLLNSCATISKNVNDTASVIDLINAAHKAKSGISKKSAFHSYDDYVFDIRKKVIKQFNIETDTGKIKKFQIIDMVSFEGGQNTIGEIVIDDSLKYFYQDNIITNKIEIVSMPVMSEIIILNLLNQHDFKQLEELSKSDTYRISGSNYFYVGMYEKKTGGTYTNLLPAFFIK